MNVPAKPNILLVIADDEGNDRLSISEEAVDPPVTPFLDMLQASGVTFPNFYTQPACKSSRASALTGLAPWRHGMGDSTTPDNGFVLDPNLDTVFRVVGRNGYESFVAGKWHLDLTDQWAQSPLALGATFADITQGNLTDWYSFDASLSGHVTKYSSTWVAWSTSVLLGAIESDPHPWLGWVAFHAAHEPFHEAPANLRTTQPDGTDYALWKGSVEAMDAELARLWAELGGQRANTLLLFFSDNGTPKDVSLNLQGQGKGTTGEGGCNTTLLAYAPWLTPGTCYDLVCVCDFFATLQRIVGDQAPTPDDSQPIRWLVEPHNGALPWETRYHVFAEKFGENGANFTGGPFEKRQRMVRNNAGWKLRRDDVRGTEEFFNLATAPGGQDGDPVAPPAQVQIELRAQLDAYSGPMT